MVKHLVVLRIKGIQLHLAVRSVGVETVYFVEPVNAQLVEHVANNNDEVELVSVDGHLCKGVGVYFRYFKLIEKFFLTLKPTKSQIYIFVFQVRTQFKLEVAL